MKRPFQFGGKSLAMMYSSNLTLSGLGSNEYLSTLIDFCLDWSLHLYHWNIIGYNQSRAKQLDLIHIHRFDVEWIRSSKAQNIKQIAIKHPINGTSLFELITADLSFCEIYEGFCISPLEIAFACYILPIKLSECIIYMIWFDPTMNYLLLKWSVLTQANHRVIYMPILFRYIQTCVCVHCIHLSVSLVL